MKNAEAHNLLHIIARDAPWLKAEVLARDLDTDNYFVWVRGDIEANFDSMVKWEAYKPWIKAHKKPSGS